MGHVDAASTSSPARAATATAATRRRRGVVVDLSQLAGVHVAAGRANVGPRRAARQHLRRARRARRRDPGRHVPERRASAAMRSAAASASPRVPGGSPPTTSSPCRSSRPTARCSSPTRSHHSDLYWACRGGGGGNFGIVTQLTFRTHPVTQGSYFIATWPWAQVEQVLASFLHWAPAAPDALGSRLPARRRARRADRPGLRPVPRQRDEPEGRARDPRAARVEPRHRHRRRGSTSCAAGRAASATRSRSCSAPGHQPFVGASDYIAQRPVAGRSSPHSARSSRRAAPPRERC